MSHSQVFYSMFIGVAKMYAMLFAYRNAHTHNMIVALQQIS